MELRLFYVPLRNKRYGDEWNLKDSAIAKNKEPQGRISLSVLKGEYFLSAGWTLPIGCAYTQLFHYLQLQKPNA